MSGSQRSLTSGLALVRVTAAVRLIVVAAIYVAERAEQPIELKEDGFDVLLIAAAIWALVMAVVAFSGRRSRVTWTEALIDLSLVAGLVYFSGGPFSEARRAFFVFPVLAAGVASARSTALTGAAAIAAFTAAALAAGLGKIEGTVPATFTGDLYLLLITIIASLLIDAKRRDALAEAHRNELLSRKLLEVQDQERRELSQWLHDEPLQLLVAARMELGAVKAGRSGAEERLGRRIKEAESTIRKAAFDLSPYALEELGLCEAIRLLAEDEGGQAGIEVSMDCEALEPHPQQDHAYFAIARELISNAVRHAQASKVCVSLRRDGSGIAMLVRDDGIGIAEEKRLDALKNGHLGLVSARERAAAVGCELRVERPADGGTCVSIRPRD